MPTASDNGDSLPGSPERNHFFYGKLMDVDQFRKDQRYFNEKRWFLNRLSLGTGVLCGLEVEPDIDGTIRIQPGIAIDGSGHEIVVPDPGISIDPRRLTDDQGEPTGELVDDGKVDVCLHYAETLTDPVPVLVADCEGDGNCAPSTVRESFRVLVRPALDEIPEPPACNLGEFPVPVNATLQKLLAQRINQPCSGHAVDPCVALARVTVPLDTGGIDSVRIRRLVIANPLMYELLLCLAERIQGFAQGRSLRYVSGDGQTGAPDTVLANPLVVQLVDGEGFAISGETVQFALTDGGEVVQEISQTDDEGLVSAQWKLGPPGEQETIAAAVGTGFTVTFRATSVAP